MQQASQQPWYQQVSADLAQLSSACDAVREPQAMIIMPDVLEADSARAVDACSAAKRGRGSTFWVAGGQAQTSQLLRAACNQVRTAQDRNLLGRFAHAGSIIAAGVVKDSDARAQGTNVRIGHDVLAKFVVGKGEREQVLFMVGHVRQIWVAIKSGRKARPVYFSVCKTDTTATFYPHPWTLVTFQGICVRLAQR